MVGRIGEVLGLETEPCAPRILHAVLASDRPELWAAPQADPHDLVAFGASRAVVRHVLVGGRLEVEEGRLTRLDLAEIYREERGAAEKAE